jgi:hypothetical protein
VIVPFEIGAGRARDGKHDELIDRARERALELEEEAELFNAARELGMVEQREIRAAEASAVGLAPRRHLFVERSRVGRQRRGIHIELGHRAAPIRDRTRRARRR